MATYPTMCESVGCGGGSGLSTTTRSTDDHRLCPRLSRIHACLENLEGLVDNCSTKLTPILRQVPKNSGSDKKPKEAECEAFELINGIDVRIERIHEKLSEIFHDVMI